MSQDRAQIGQVYEFPPDGPEKERGNRYEIYREENGLLYGRSLDAQVFDFDIHGGPESWPKAAKLVDGKHGGRKPAHPPNPETRTP